MLAFKHLSLSRQFLIASLPILLAGMLVVGWWVGTMIERGVVHRMGAVTSNYVESFISPLLQPLAQADSLDNTDRATLTALLTGTPLGKRIVALKIWSRDGRVLYSTNPNLIGRTFPIEGGLAAALTGEVHSELSDLTHEENTFERRDWLHLIETYSPIHANKTGTVIAVAEFYHSPTELVSEIRAAQLRSLLVVAGTMLAMYLIIFALVQRGSQTIDAQRRQLSDKVDELSQLVDQNAKLHDRVRRAAARTTALNERFLRRIAADLHDGPGQDLALALMRFDTITQSSLQYLPENDRRSDKPEALRAIHTTLQSALTDLRAISLGLQLPEIEQLPSCEISQRAVRDFERKTGAKVELKMVDAPAIVPLPVKIALYRFIQESLANGFRHGGGATQRVDVSQADGQLKIVVSDNGVGFDPHTVNTTGRVGLAGMRERVEVLGGSYQLQTAPGRGTVISASLPLQLAGVDYD
jgi:signal transduction histidine kinase